MGTALRERVTNVRQVLNWVRKNVRTVTTRYVTDVSKRLQLPSMSLSAEQMNRQLREINQLRSADIDVAMSNFFQFLLIPSEHLHDAMTTLPFHDLIESVNFYLQSSGHTIHTSGASSGYTVLGSRTGSGARGRKRPSRESARERYPCTEMRMLQRGSEVRNRYHHTDDLLQQHLSKSVADINSSKLTNGELRDQ